jgi:hypothetical protein
MKKALVGKRKPTVYLLLVVFIGYAFSFAVPRAGYAIPSLHFGASAQVPSTHVAPGGLRGLFYKPAPLGPNTEKVLLGIEPTQIYNVAPGQGIWQANFYMWWRWKGNIDPSTSTYITNNADASASYTITYSFLDKNGQPKPTVLKDGYFYQQAYIRMGLADDFPLSRYPLDRQDLQFRIENTTYDYKQLVYTFDRKNMSNEQTIDVPGWKTNVIKDAEYVHHYQTNFGYLDEGSDFQNYSLLTYNINISRPVSHFIFKMLLPLLVVLIAGLVSLYVRAENFDTRLALAGSGLLTLIFLQLGYSGDLPASVPVVLMDNLYAVGYLVIIITFGRIMWTTHKLHHLPAEEQSDNRFMRTDHRLAAFLMVFSALAMSALVFL